MKTGQMLAYANCQCYNSHMTSYHDSTHFINVQKILGTKSDGKKKNAGAGDLRASILEGLPFSAFEAVQKEIGLPQNQLSEIIGVPTRTIARRKENQHLTSVESDRLYRVARIFAFTAEVLGDAEKARTWLKSPNRGLSGEIPLTLLDTEIGTQQVEDVLQRLKYGIYG
jgi:putative toxin-antitoxin system antitoxin component (TIGR02293 family)